MSTSTQLGIAKNFAGFENPIDEGWVKVLMFLDVDLDFLNDYGIFLYMFSNAPLECEWLLTFGSMIQITDISPMMMQNNEIVKMKDYFDKDLDEK